MRTLPWAHHVADLPQVASLLFPATALFSPSDPAAPRRRSLYTPHSSAPAPVPGPRSLTPSAIAPWGGRGMRGARPSPRTNGGGSAGGTSPGQGLTHQTEQILQHGTGTRSHPSPPPHPPVFLPTGEERYLRHPPWAVIWCKRALPSTCGTGVICTTAMQSLAYFFTCVVQSVRACRLFCGTWNFFYEQLLLQ